MEVTSNGGADFRELGRRFRAAGEGGAAMRKALTKRVKGILDVIVSEQKRRVTSMKVKGTGGRGSRRRAQFHAARSKRKSRHGHGLRTTIASGITSKVSYSGYKIGARISVQGNKLPQSQRTLPRRLNSKKGWRHPLFGNRQHWYTQHGEPYFDEPIERHKKDVRREVNAAAAEVMNTLK